MGATGHSPAEAHEAPPPTLLGVVAFATLTVLALMERFDALPGATAALASARYVFRL